MNLQVGLGVEGSGFRGFGVSCLGLRGFGGFRRFGGGLGFRGFRV